MHDSFEIPVTYRGKDLAFNATLQVFGYTHRLEVGVDGQPIIFEQDEEGQYRAVMPFDAFTLQPQVDIELLALIAETLNFSR